EPCRPSRRARERELPKSLDEWHAERVLHVTGGVELPVRLIQRLVLNRDVWRIPHHRVVVLTKDAIGRLRILHVEPELERQLTVPRAEEERVSCGNVQPEVRRLHQPAYAARSECRNHQTE